MGVFRSLCVCLVGGFLAYPLGFPDEEKPSRTQYKGSKVQLGGI